MRTLTLTSMGCSLSDSVDVPIKNAVINPLITKVFILIFIHFGVDCGSNWYLKMNKNYLTIIIIKNSIIIISNEK